MKKVDKTLVYSNNERNRYISHKTTRRGSKVASAKHARSATRRNTTRPVGGK